MIWLQQNWLWLLVGLLFIWMHLGHGSHGGHGRHNGQSPTPRRPADDRDPTGDPSGDPTREADEPVRATGHRH